MDSPESVPVVSRVRTHRARLRARGLRPVQIWVPDVRSPRFTEAAHDQSTAVAAGEAEADDQAFVEAIFWDRAGGDDGTEASSGGGPEARR